MEYFCLNNQREGSCYQEHQKGRWKGDHWLDSSLFIHDDTAYKTGIYDIYFEVIKGYDPYSARPYTITRGMWDIILEKAIIKGGILKLAISELTPWVEENFKTHKEFTIITI